MLGVSILIGQTASVFAEPAEPAGEPPSTQGALSSGQVRIALKVSGLSSPVGVVNAGDGTNRLFVVEQRGTVRIFNGTSLAPGFFLDIRNVPGGISTGGERGLLGLAFHPNFESNRKLFVYYTSGNGALVIAEMTANAARTAVPTNQIPDALLSIPHPRTNHNGGQLLFGADGYLYVFTGDGGGGGDPDENGQDINEYLGKTLRIQPNLSGGYSSPSGNPYHGSTPGLDAIWSIGLRNPWRASFDRANGNLWIADVGQGSWEEINREPAGTPGRNYGWDRCEGTHLFEGPGPCASGGLTGPVAEYGHGSGNCSVTGGFVYRGSVFEDFVGHYVLGDYCSGNLWTLPAGAGSPQLRFHRDTNVNISSFGESESGELYLTDHGGRLYRVVAPPFNDVTNSAHIDAITWLFYEGVTGGCGGGGYCPTDSVTREEMASFLDRALNPPNTGIDFFSDDNSSVHEAAINRLAAAGITGGCTPTRYCPTGTVTRQQMASFIVRGWDLPASSTNFFVDDNGSVHENDINSLAAAGITGGCTPTRFCPLGPTTREEMASFLKRAMT